MARPFPVSAFSLLLLAGCTQLPQPKAPPFSPPTATPETAVPPSSAARPRLSQVHVNSPDRLRAGAFADALRDELRARGFEVRASETAAPSGEGGAAALTLAHAVAEGATPPANARSLAYLHPNAPRLLLLVDVVAGAGTTLRVGAVFADTTDGSVLWSFRLEEEPPEDDRQLRRLAGRLLGSLPPPQS